MALGFPLTVFLGEALGTVVERGSQGTIIPLVNDDAADLLDLFMTGIAAYHGKPQTTDYRLQTADIRFETHRANIVGLV